jgi:hypothetical protein
MRTSTVVAPNDHSDVVARPMRVSDMMVLIAALFIALAWDRAGVLDALRIVSQAPVSGLHLAIQAASAVLLLIPFLAVGSLAVCVLRLQRPRPSWHRLLQQPGTVASALAVAALVPIGSMIVASHAVSGRPMAVAWARALDDFKPDQLTVVASLVGLAVALAWIVMKARRQWKPEPGWIDGLGRVLGWGWIAMIVGGMVPIGVWIVRLANGLL